MKESLIIAFVVLNLGLSGQNLFPEKFSNCDSKEFFLEGKEIYSQNQNNDLISDIIQNIDIKTLKKIKGEISIQVYIDTLGIPCCISIKNDLNAKGKEINFKQIIDAQTKWSPPYREGKNSSVSTIIKLTFSKKKVILQRLGFNMMTGLIELSKHEMKYE